MLDELNLAPTDVLEALNRLLDDNRELFVPETSEVVRPHPHFMLFATQNPPGSYGGRKVLSRAFRNRFLEMQMDEIPEAELSQIEPRSSQIEPISPKSLISPHISQTELTQIPNFSPYLAGRAHADPDRAVCDPRLLLRQDGAGDAGPPAAASLVARLPRQAWLSPYRPIVATVREL